MKKIYYGGAILSSVLGVALLWQGLWGGDRQGVASLNPQPQATTPQPPQADSRLALAPPSPTPSPTPVLQPDAQRQAILDQYMDSLSSFGVDPQVQGVWVESSQGTMASYQGTQPLPVASLTKMATTLVALDRWGVNHRFITRVVGTGPVVDGVLQGDLVVWGGGDPLYVWESAIDLGNRLNKAGIRQVKGRLVVDGVFIMNFERDRTIAGAFLREALDSRQWGEDVKLQYSYMDPNTPQPEVEILGETVVTTAPLPNREQLPLLVQQSSLRLVRLLKQMNMYSNNAMADLLADLLGGAAALTQKTEELAQIPPGEVRFINGSGLGPENQISARGVCRILGAISDRLSPEELGLPDVMPIAHEDPGTLEGRGLPDGTIAKTGTLWNVSTLAGLVPQGSQPSPSLTAQPSACFAILNQGEDLGLFHDQQDVLVNSLKQSLQSESSTVSEAF